MAERAYTVRELDALREAVENKWLYGRYRLGGYASQSRPYMEAEKVACVEQMVRTHMLAGHTAEDLYASESRQGRVNAGAAGETA